MTFLGDKTVTNTFNYGKHTMESYKIKHLPPLKPDINKH